MDDWQDIATAPRDGTFVLVRTPKKTPVVAYFSQAVGFYPNLGWQSVPGDVRQNPTEWVPLPGVNKSHIDKD